jgi:hypothetical protein
VQNKAQNYCSAHIYEYSDLQRFVNVGRVRAVYGLTDDAHAFSGFHKNDWSDCDVLLQVDINFSE